MGFLDFIFDPGKEDREQANELYAQSVGNQQNLDAWKKKMMEQRLGLANAMLYGGNTQNPNMATADGVNSAPGVDVKGALPQAQDWEARFFNFLETSPDTAYNSQRGQLERGIKDAEKSLKTSLNNRGLADSTLGMSKLANLGLNRARGLSGLEGERIDRQGQRISQGNQAAQSILDRALNMGNSASGVATSFNTNVPSLINNQAANYANQAANAGSGIGTDLISEASRSMFDKMFPTTVQKQPTSSAGGIGQNVLMKYLTGGIFG